MYPFEKCLINVDQNIIDKIKTSENYARSQLDFDSNIKQEGWSYNGVYEGRIKVWTFPDRKWFIFRSEIIAPFNMNEIIEVTRDPTKYVCYDEHAETYEAIETFNYQGRINEGRYPCPWPFSARYTKNYMFEYASEEHKDFIQIGFD